MAIRKMSLVPQPIRSAITVNYGNVSCNTESDITVIIFPNRQEYNIPAEQISVTDFRNKKYEPLKGRFLNQEMINYLVQRDFNEYEIGIIQCKTNWNDNAQIPMLWDMIYSAGGFRGRNITIGKDNFSIQSAQQFTYAFVTVPSNSKEEYKHNKVSVKRVTNLSGGNYWGKPTLEHVSKSIKEIFTNNYQSGIRTTLRMEISNAIPKLNVTGDLII